MNVVQKALWFVETHNRGPLLLEQVADACHVSPFHLTRAFGDTTGLSLMRYVRARRLTEAARQLAGGESGILRLALELGYSSHEAFTRAFREHFGCTPEQVRAQQHVDNIQLQEALPMTSTQLPELGEPRIERTPPRTYGGLVAHYESRDLNGIPDQWRRFAAHLGHIPGQVGPVTYGVCYNFDLNDHYDYMCGVELSAEHGLPREFKTVHVPAQRYVVFRHAGHIAGIRDVLSAIWTNWLPSSGYTPAKSAMLERYGPEFDARTGMGGFEIWMPVEE